MVEPTPLTIQTISSRYPSAMDDFEWETADDANGNTYIATGRELVFVRNNDDMAAHNVTVVSVPNRNGRSGDLVESVLATESRMIYLGVDGWRNRTTGLVRINAATDDIDFAVVRLPN